MALPIRWVISMDEETARIFERLQKRYAPLIGNNRSATIRLLLRILDWASLEGEDFKMGEWMKQVPVKLDEETISRIDEDVRRFAPFCSGRSAMVRALVYVAYGQVDAGKLKLTLAGIQRAIASRKKPKRDA